MTAIETLLKKYRDLELPAIIDYERFNHYAIVHHSSTIEGSTLTENETRLLLEENLTPKGKPLEHSLMTRDHYIALQFILQSAAAAEEVTPDFIKKINSIILKSTGKIYNTLFGSLNSAKGIFRKGNVSAGDSYFVSYDKVEPHTTRLCARITEGLKESVALTDRLDLAFDAQFDLLTIHPFYDGNGRTARLLMNYIQLISGLPMGIVYKEDKAGYYDALVQTRQREDITIFRSFMYTQYHKFLEEDIKKALKLRSPGTKGKGYSLIF